MDPVLSLAKKYGLYVIEDCADAHGALYRGQKVGSLGDVGCFSFCANEIITTGEGGMLTTSDIEIVERAQSLRNLAFGESNKFMHEDIGFSYRLTNLQAAIGCGQLERIEQAVTRKRNIAEYYGRRLRDVPGLQLPVEESYARNVYWMYHILLREEFGCSREIVMGKLRNWGIETCEAYIPYNMQDIFIRRGWTNRSDCPVANYVARNGFCIPSSPLLTDEDLEYITGRLIDIQKERGGAMYRLNLTEKNYL
jgi:perosamine synthetase